MFCRKIAFSDMERGFAQAAHVSRLEQKDIERCFARLFSSDDGRKVLAWLQVMTFHRAGAINSTDDQLRFMEGQRNLVASILRMIDRGKTE